MASLTDNPERNATPAARPAWAQAPVPDAGFTRHIRVLTGVAEPVLDRMSTERPRYTALACVMICTALLGGISMFFALSEVVGSARAWIVPLALFWSVLVLCIDRWLVSSMAGHRLRSRLPAALLRLLVAAVIGFIIAEPLVLQIFGTAVEAQVHKERQQNIDGLRGALLACNPTGGTRPTAPPAGYSCANLRLNVSSLSADYQKDIDARTSDEKNVQSQITAIDDELTRRNTTMNNECNGASGPGLTGRVGNGPACQQDQQAYNDYRNSHPTTALVNQRNTDEQVIAADQAKMTAAAQNTDELITAAIQRRLGQETQVGAPIGLIERFNALIHLMLASGVIEATTWLLRFFFILIDCLPVVVKFASGVTPYDQFVAEELDCAAQVHRQEIAARLSVCEKRVSVELKEINAEMDKRAQSVEFMTRRHAKELENAELAAIDEDYERRLRAAGLGDEHRLNGRAVRLS